MSRDFTSDDWRGILHLAKEASALPRPDRTIFLQVQSADVDVIAQALELADQFDQEPDEPLGCIDTFIGRFQLLDYLGSGGSGEVYTANDPELGRIVSIKTFRSEVTSALSVEQSFIQEARAASALNHPNIVTVHEIVRSGTKVAIVMELVPGSPLRKLCGTTVQQETVFSIGRQVAEALVAAHSAGIVHGDIKPENIMVLPDGRVKLLDFGSARATTGLINIGAQTIPGGIPRGTLRYMSPEHFRAGPITASSDIFALGLVLCELASGQHPFAKRPHESAFEIFHAIGTKDLPANLLPDKNFPSLFNSTLRAMMSTAPELRPSAGDVLMSLRESSRGTPGLDRQQSWKISKRWRWAAVATGLVLLAIGAGIISLRTGSGTSKFTLQRRITNLVAENRATAAALSADGKRLSYANADGIFVQLLESSEVSMLHGPPDFVVDHLAWMVDGTKLIVSGFYNDTNRPALWSVPTSGRASRELRAEGRYGVPSPDGTKIAFISGDFSSIGTMDPDGQGAEILSRVPSDDSVHLVLWSFNGRRLLLQRRHVIQEENFSKNHKTGDRITWSLDIFDPKNRTVIGSRANRPDQQISSVATTSDDLIAFIAADDYPPAGRDQLWSVRLNPNSVWRDSSAKPLAEPSLLREHTFSDLSLSADGSKAVILKQSIDDSVFVATFNRAALQLSNVHRLTLASTASYPHAWTPDSQQVIFESSREGTSDLFKQHIKQRLPEALLSTAKRWEFLPQVSPDGKNVLFASTPNSVRPFTLMRIGISGGSTEGVPVDGPLDEFRCSISPKGRCVLRKTVGRTELVYYDLDPIGGIGRELARTSWVSPVLGDWDVSPDGNFIVVPIHDWRFAKVRVLQLDPKRKEREVTLAGLMQLASVRWAADGTGWFVSIGTTVGKRMYFSDLKGRITFLGDISGWAVPSPDGKKLAFLNQVVDSNAWLLTRQ